MKKESNNYQLLTQAPVSRAIIKMALPSIVIMLITGFYNIADTFFVGKLSTQATAAVGVVFSVMFFVQAIGFFFGHGSGNYISRELGAQRHDNAQRMTSTGFFLSFTLGLAVLLIGEACITPLSLWLGSTPTILPYTEQYRYLERLSSPLR